jgi:hypothetical protein
MQTELSTAKQIAIVKELLAQSRTAKVTWERSGNIDAFKSVRAQAVVVLDKVGEPSRVRLRFSATGHRDYDTTIEQSLPDAEAFSDELELDALLALLHQYIEGKVGARPSAADLFFQSNEE